MAMWFQNKMLHLTHICNNALNTISIKCILLECYLKLSSEEEASTNTKICSDEKTETGKNYNCPNF